MTQSIRLAIDARNVLGEGPLWCPRQQALWWIDIDRPTLWKWTAADGARSWPLAKPPGCIALLEDGRLLIVFRSRMAIWSEESGALGWLASPNLQPTDERFNDGKVDAQGRLWVGTFDRKVARPIGKLYRFDADTGLQPMDDGHTLSNGIGWSPDGRTLYFSETHSKRIYRYVFDAGAGRLGAREIFVQVTPGHGGPDGLTTDAEGGVWCAMFERGCLHRYGPDGTLDHVIELPVSRPTSCAFGGPDLRTLYVTTARFGMDEAALASEQWAGGVLAIQVPQRGMLQPRMAFTPKQQADNDSND